MAKRPVITVPDPILRQVSLPVETIDAAIGRLIDDMFETMYAAPGVGLAAVQVGVPRRVIVLDAADDEAQRAPLALINPRILATGEATRLYEEGCLSIPDFRVDIERPVSVRVAHLDRQGRPREFEAFGLAATVIQHEMDHLEGKLIIDYLSRLKRDIVVRKFKKIARADE